MCLLSISGWTDLSLVQKQHTWACFRWQDTHQMCSCLCKVPVQSQQQPLFPFIVAYRLSVVVRGINIIYVVRIRIHMKIMLDYVVPVSVVDG